MLALPRIRTIRRVHAAAGRGRGWVGYLRRNQSGLDGSGGPPSTFGWWYLRVTTPVPSYYRPARRQAAAPPAVGDVVAALALDPVQGLSAAAIRSVAVRPSAGKRGDADRCADRDRPSLLADERPVAEGFEDPLPGASGLVRVGLGQDDRELVAAVAGGDVGRAQRRPDELRGAVSTRSPNRWPSVSLTSLKSSRSSIRTLSGRRPDARG